MGKCYEHGEGEDDEGKEGGEGEEGGEVKVGNEGVDVRDVIKMSERWRSWRRRG